MAKQEITYLPVAYNFGACTDLREYIHQEVAKAMTLPVRLQRPSTFTTCPTCDGPLIVEPITGHLYCPNCNLVKK